VRRRQPAASDTGRPGGGGLLGTDRSPSYQ
jgi:hypothetical protein